MQSQLNCKIIGQPDNTPKNDQIPDDLCSESLSYPHHQKSYHCLLSAAQLIVWVGLHAVLPIHFVIQRNKFKVVVW